MNASSGVSAAKGPSRISSESEATNEVEGATQRRAFIGDDGLVGDGEDVFITARSSSSTTLNFMDGGGDLATAALRRREKRQEATHCS